jgi:hypothetical protein
MLHGTVHKNCHPTPAHPSPEDLDKIFTAHPSCTNITDTFRICLDTEDAAIEHKLKMFFRIFGYLAIYAPSEQVQACVIREILTCEEDTEKLHQLGKLYFNDLFLLCEFLPMPVYRS